MTDYTNIVVSGRPYKFPGDSASYDDIVEIWNKLHKDENLYIIGTPGIDYDDDATSDNGILMPGQSIGVKDGTSFSVDPEHVS